MIWGLRSPDEPLIEYLKDKKKRDKTSVVRTTWSHPDKPLSVVLYKFKEAPLPIQALKAASGP